MPVSFMLASPTRLLMAVERERALAGTGGCWCVWKCLLYPQLKGQILKMKAPCFGSSVCLTGDRQWPLT